jgi:hypothetical protein
MGSTCGFVGFAWNVSASRLTKFVADTSSAGEAATAPSLSSPAAAAAIVAAVETMLHLSGDANGKMGTDAQQGSKRGAVATAAVSETFFQDRP